MVKNTLNFILNICFLSFQNNVCVREKECVKERNCLHYFHKNESHITACLTLSMCPVTFFWFFFVLLMFLLCTNYQLYKYAFHFPVLKYVM